MCIVIVWSEEYIKGKHYDIQNSRKYTHLYKKCSRTGINLRKYIRNPPKKYKVWERKCKKCYHCEKHRGYSTLKGKSSKKEKYESNNKNSPKKTNNKWKERNKRKTDYIYLWRSEKLLSSETIFFEVLGKRHKNKR